MSDTNHERAREEPWPRLSAPSDNGKGLLRRNWKAVIPALAMLVALAGYAVWVSHVIVRAHEDAESRGKMEQAGRECLEREASHQERRGK